MFVMIRLYDDIMIMLHFKPAIHFQQFFFSCKAAIHVLWHFVVYKLQLFMQQYSRPMLDLVASSGKSLDYSQWNTWIHFFLHYIIFNRRLPVRQQAELAANLLHFLNMHFVWTGQFDRVKGNGWERDGGVSGKTTLGQNWTCASGKQHSALAPSLSFNVSILYV